LIDEHLNKCFIIDLGGNIYGLRRDIADRLRCQTAVDAERLLDEEAGRLRIMALPFV